VSRRGWGGALLLLGLAATGAGFVASRFGGPLVGRARELVPARFPHKTLLEELSKEELYERAQAADIQGRSNMTKDELVEALKAHAR
jgi:hypothetical protein